ncbi:hypothetical protein ACFORL_00185 [Legionella dresdenensis]|uniref:Uncharacterized protein n=1 Tax=Legionella dresdenensis TaxID=450200 RepID=A0ABV8CC33_9GAMM
MFKKLALGLLATAISGYSNAGIIELDAFDPDHCRQQILQSSDDLPVIAAYTSEIGNESESEAFMDKFELLAKEHPERTFFKWDANRDVQHTTQALCMQQLGFFMQPSIMLLAVVKYGTNGQAIMTSPLRLQWAGEMTITDMNNFIAVGNSSIRKSVLLQKSHH